VSTPGLSIVFDNYPFDPKLTSLWGFAAVIRLGAQTILFDTGSNGRVLLKNMAALGIDPLYVDTLFLSHPHWDHIGGLDSFLEIRPDATVVVHEGFSKHLIRDLETLCGELVVVGEGPRALAPGVWSTGMLDSAPPEQAMVIESGDSTLVVSGCAHPGMERIVIQSASILGKRVRFAVGGFHLMYADDAAIQHAVAALQGLGVEYVLPTHCTGDAAKGAFRRAYGERFLEGGVGRVIGIPW
jgi:7,8-dihydropterin-6-yl-methyl-4-(beta-D-ribofuranosyl)aminobenzene 5'-phosphate synthase